MQPLKVSVWRVLHVWNTHFLKVNSVAWSQWKGLQETIKSYKDVTSRAHEQTSREIHKVLSPT